LGMAFGWGAVMAWASETGAVFDSPVPWLLFVANICWSLSYDTAYALADRSDDLKIGVKSTAIWFGEKAVTAIVVLGGMVMLILGLVAWQYGMAVKIGWLLAVLYQFYLCWELWKCGETWGFDFFLKSHWVGLLFCLGFAFNGF